MTAPPMPMPPLPTPTMPPLGGAGAAAPVAGAPPPPQALPFAGRWLPPAQQDRLKAKDAASSAYLAALRAAQAVYAGTPAQGGAPLPPTGSALPPAMPGPGTAMVSGPSGLPPAGMVPPPGLGATSSPAPAALPAQPMLPPMAHGGVVPAPGMVPDNTGQRVAGIEQYPRELFPQGVEPLPGVLPAPVLVLALLQRAGHLPAMAAGGVLPAGLLSQLGGMSDGGGNGGPVLPGGVADGVVGGAAPPAAGLTPDEQSTVAFHNAGPPPPRAFLSWLTDVAPNSPHEMERDMAQAYAADPGSINAIWNISRGFFTQDPSEASPELLKMMGLPNGQPDIGMRIAAQRQDRTMSGSS